MNADPEVLRGLAADVEDGLRYMTAAEQADDSTVWMLSFTVAEWRMMIAALRASQTLPAPPATLTETGGGDA